MITLSDLANFIGGKIGMADAASLTKIKGFATQRYKAMYAGALWKDALSIYTFAVAANQQLIILPSQVAFYVAAKLDTQGLIPIDQAFLFSSNPELWSAVGTPTYTTEMAAIATKAMPLAAGEAIRIVSNNAADVSLMTVYGEDPTGNPLEDRFGLNGVAPNNSPSGTFAVVYGLSKAATIGTITVTGATSGTALQTLLPAENQRLHRRLMLHAIPSVATTVLVLGKRQATPFTNDNDATGLPSLCDQALQAMVHGDALEWQQQYGKAQGKFAEGLKLIDDARKTETYQAAQSARMTPADALADGCNPNDFL